MKCDFAQVASRISFDIPMKAPDILEQIAFIVLVGLRFDGEIGEPLRFTRGTEEFGCIDLKFLDFEHWDGAKAHCGSHLDGHGSVNTTYVGALERADPGLGTARSLLEQLRSLPPN